MIRLEKVKRPAGVFWFELTEVAPGWLLRAPGSAWGAPHDSGTWGVTALLHLVPGRPWVPWWVADPADPRVEIDVCRPVERTPGGWRYVDLELDPVRHENSGRIEIEDDDEYEEALRRGWMSAADGELARRTADDLAAALADPGDDRWRHGWEVLDRRT